MSRVIWIVLDSVGMGAMPDAASYGDEKANTLGHVNEKASGLQIPHLQSLGLGNIEGMEGIEKVVAPKASFARLKEKSNGKDTTTGHWEMVGIYTETPFPTYPNGFPEEIIKAFEAQTGTKVMGNCTASGTQIIEDLGEEHVATGNPIVYTSADSVFQIAAHEGVIPLKRLYEMCEIARKILVGQHEVARVIARPFEGTVGNFTRTANRRDFAITPPQNNLLSYLKDSGLEVMAIGKIEDIFAKVGITGAVHTKDNMDGVNRTLEAMDTVKEGLIFTNLVDFDMKWGHRNNFKAYGEGLEQFDERLPELMNKMKQDDILVITADHGCDPTIPGTDHTREYVPLLVYGASIKPSVDLHTRESFADIGQTISELFGTKSLDIGESFLSQIKK